MWGSSREKSGARPSAVSTFTSLPVLILISASAAARYCLSVSSQMARRSTSASSSSGRRSARPAALHLALADFVGIIQIVAASTNRNFQPAIARLVAVQKRAVRAGNVHALRIRDGVAEEVGRGILCSSVLMERSSSVCRAARSGERLAWASAGAACARLHAWRAPASKQNQCAEARKSVDYDSIVSKDASLAFRRDRESFSVRHRKGAYKPG